MFSRLRFGTLGNPSTTDTSHEDATCSIAFACRLAWLALSRPGQKRDFPTKIAALWPPWFRTMFLVDEEDEVATCQTTKEKTNDDDATKKPKTPEPVTSCTTHQTTSTQTVPTGVLQAEEDEIASCQQVTPTNGFDRHAAIHTCLQDEDEENEDVATCRDNRFGTRHFPQTGHPQPPWALRRWQDLAPFVVGFVFLCFGLLGLDFVAFSPFGSHFGSFAFGLSYPLHGHLVHEAPGESQRAEDDEDVEAVTCQEVIQFINTTHVTKDRCVRGPEPAPSSMKKEGPPASVSTHERVSHVWISFGFWEFSI